MTEGFYLSRAIAIAKKEVFHILRDRFTLGLALGLPFIVVILFGFAIEFNQSNIPTAIIDQDRSQTSRQLVRILSSSSFFKVDSVDHFLSSRLDQLEKLLESGDSQAVLVIPSRLESHLYTGRGAKIQVLVNAADNASAASVLHDLSQIQGRVSRELFQSPLGGGVQLESRFLFNPELNSKWFTVPGLMVLIMTMIAILLTALTVAREWEFGSMELLLSTPVKPLEIIIGKIAPYAVLCLFAVALVYFCARLIFDVPFRGNIWVYLLGCVLFLMSYLAQGLMISVITRRQMLAMQLSMISGLLPSQLLSGFIFPIENMPRFFQNLTCFLPARWFMEISRKSFLQGATLWQMKEAFLALFGLMILFVTVAFRKFKKDLEP